MKLLNLLGITLVVLLFASCKPSDSSAAPTSAPAKVQAYDLRGIIEQLPTAQAPHQLVIRHEATSNMGSMAMPFFIDSEVPLTGLVVGDKVSFRFEIDRNAGAEHVTKLQKLPPDTTLNIPGAVKPSTTPTTGPMKMPGM